MDNKLRKKCLRSNGENCFSIGCYIGELYIAKRLNTNGCYCMHEKDGTLRHFFQKKGLYAYLSMFYIIESTSELVAMCGFTWLALKDSGSIVVQAMCLHPV